MAGINVMILDTATGERRSFHHPQEWSHDPEDYSDYLWSEGNYSCDCNRASFFAEAGGEPQPDTATCGHERYLLCITDPETGEQLYADDGWSVALSPEKESA